MTELLTVSEVAAIFKTSKVQVRKMIREDILPALKIGREYRISKAFLEAFIEEAIA